MFFCVIENARNVGRTELLMAKSAATKTNVAKKTVPKSMPKEGRDPHGGLTDWRSIAGRSRLIQYSGPMVGIEIPVVALHSVNRK